MSFKNSIVLFCFAILVVPWTGFAGTSCTLLNDGTIELTSTFSAPVIQPEQLYAPGSDAKGLEVHSVILDGARSLGHPGEPVLPVKNMVVLIPQDRDLLRVELISGDTVTVRGNLLVEPGQYEVPLSSTGPHPVLAPEPAIYNSRDLYPAERIEHVTTQYSRGYKLVSFNLRPVVYAPADRELRYSPDMTVQILTVPSRGRPAEVVRCRDLESDREWVRRKVLNPELVDSYLADPDTLDTPLSGNREYYPYVIVTVEGFNMPFQGLIAHKQAHGYPGTIVYMSWIETNYSGADSAAKLRNFIIDAYNNWSTEYVLLGGDDDKSDVGGESGDVLVPSRDFYSDTDYGETDSEIPADMYFACLDGSFNNDNDSYWAEPTDGIGGGEVDWFGEVHIGRACVDSGTEAGGFVNATMAYENADPDAAYMTKAWMVGELLWSDPTYGGDYKDEIKDGASTHGYTTVGFPPEWTVSTLYDRDLPGSWTASQLEAIMNSNDIHVINHLGHSDVDYCARLYNDDVDNDLTNSVGFFMYSQGCYDGSFDNRGAYGSTMSVDCICEHHHYQSQGAFAFIGNSRYGWGQHSSTDGSSQYYDRQFFDAIFGEEIVELGAANQDSKEDNIGYLDYGANRWVGYELNLFGCPQTPLGGGLSSAGAIGLDRGTYGSGVDITITVRDLDLNTNPGAADTVDITMTTSSGDTETVTLTENATGSATFLGTITMVDSGVGTGNGTLEGSHGCDITATYIDASDGSGGVNIPRTAEAQADFQGPVISNVSVDFVGFDSATISFDTSESAAGSVYYGTADPSAYNQGGSSGTSHSITLTGLSDCTLYLFYVEASDPAGNTAVDDASGAYYTFTTMELVTMLSENMDTNPGWSCQSQWAWGVPTGQNQDAYGEPDPTSGYTGNNVYGYNLNGDYSASMSSTAWLTTETFDCSGATEVFFSFWCWLGVERDMYDNAYLSISNNNGSNWTVLWENGSTTLEGGSWEYWEFDISTYAAGQSQVQIRWGIGPTDTSWQYCGWNIDDVAVYYSQACNPGPSPTPNPTHTPAPPTMTPTVGPTGTQTPVPPPTATSQPTYTPSPYPTAAPTNTPIPTYTPVPTNTPIPTFTSPPQPTNTVPPQPTHTAPPQPTNTPVPTNTPTPTLIPSHTPAPPTPTPTAPPGQPTYTPVPTHTPEPTAEPTAEPTNTPAAVEMAIDIQLNQNMYKAGDHFLLTCDCTNPDESVTLCEFIILDVYGQYFFWPGWSTSMDYTMATLPANDTMTETILDFTWPQGSFGTVENLCFWAALLEPGTFALKCDIDREEFGYTD